MGVYQRPPRSDELWHWGKGSVASNHKYIAKIGDKYFYTMEELKAFKQGVTKKASDNFSKLRDRVYNAAGGAQKRKAQASAQRANAAKTNLADARQKKDDALRKTDLVKGHYFSSGEKGYGNRNHPGRQQSIDNDRARGDELIRSANGTHQTKSEGDRDPNSRVRRTQRNNDRERRFKEASDNAINRYEVAKNASKNAQRQANADKNAYDRTLVGRVENAGKKVNHVKNSIDRGRQKVLDYIADRKRQQEEVSRLSREMDAAEKRGDGSVKRINDTTRVMFSDPEIKGNSSGKKKAKEYIDSDGVKVSFESRSKQKRDPDVMTVEEAKKIVSQNNKKQTKSSEEAMREFEEYARKYNKKKRKSPF